jgi:GNAT superfamily N-acetyltransferase
MLVCMFWRRHRDASAVDGLRVSEYDEADLGSILDLIRSCSRLSEAVVPYSSASFRAAYLDPGSHPHRAITLLMRRRHPAGLALLSTRRQYVAAGRAYLEVLYVEPRYPGPGPLGLLVHTARQKLLDEGLSFTALFTFLDDRTMARQQEHLQDMGFVRTRRCRYLVFSPPAGYPSPRFPEGFVLAREPIPGNEERVAALFNQAFLPPSLIPAAPENFRPLPGDVWLIRDGALFLYDGPELAGCVQILRHYEGRTPMTFVARLGVVERYRGRGLGRELLRAAIAAGRENGLQDIKLTVYSDTPDAEHIYRSEGFSEHSCTSELTWTWD